MPNGTRTCGGSGSSASTRRSKEVKTIFEEVEEQDSRLELNLYVTGVEDEDVETAAAEEERGPHE